ncbi:MAG: hypothetical protein HQK91_13735 [Nitrospirae bacterium]|nr:hypothetical protein [Nitrospirota bacterium]
MTDITMISTALSSIKTAIEITKYLKDGNFSLEKAELKMKLADLIDALATTKMEFAEIQEMLSIKDKRIAELEDAFEFKDKLVHQYDAYYKADESGNPTGVAFCLKCWDNDHKQRKLIYEIGYEGTRACVTCSSKYARGRADDIIKNLCTT